MNTDEHHNQIGLNFLFLLLLGVGVFLYLVLCLVTRVLVNSTLYMDSFWIDLDCPYAEAMVAEFCVEVESSKSKYNSWFEIYVIQPFHIVQLLLIDNLLCFLLGTIMQKFESNYKPRIF